MDKHSESALGGMLNMVEAMAEVEFHQLNAMSHLSSASVGVYAGGTAHVVGTLADAVGATSAGDSLHALGNGAYQAAAHHAEQAAHAAQDAWHALVGGSPPHDSSSQAPAEGSTPHPPP